LKPFHLPGAEKGLELKSYTQLKVSKKFRWFGMSSMNLRKIHKTRNKWKNIILK